MVTSVGTPLLQQISLMNKGVLDKIEETPGNFVLTNPLEGDIRIIFSRRGRAMG
jgi:hypothetical protein